ncbi:regulatory [Fusarium sporotrichioides]|uniref:Trichothecene biosynthesis transcription regulator TRI10 n=2 Tax=Fusarium sporotrichioides TaxID=5514 RepID=TRI10_FUSSP|nr:RecName: Full=Trichothecene biosynthesis transcription regulator TRI10; AltName: Full=Core trichothecene cluster (CTC) protein 10 [Fusarium sporotrichioides]AAK33069.1 putative trichothecene biosynthetic gene [Fusarium sporotrichioides]AAK53383.1 trichothecene biosynthesis regulator TRI10 [Fusarium sporotrichioides]RGP67092.1 regulatory [Fusarium sporotrichioides]
MEFPKPRQFRETSLLMYYLDVVFPLQYISPNNNCLGKREWLLTILTSARPTYYATLCLALLYKESLSTSCRSEQTLVWKREKTYYYILALQESQKLLGGLNKTFGITRLKGTVVALACMLQLIGFESSHLSRGDWRVHLLAANTLIPVLAEGWSTALQSGPPATSIWCELDESDFDSIDDQTSLSFEYLGALRFLSNSLAKIGILSCISVGPAAPFEDYGHLLDQPGLIQLEEVLGCKNWAMLTILEVGKLDRWKRQEQEHNRLSLKTLAMRAMIIEDMLTDELQKLPTSETLPDLITHIYAASIATYLHTVVSGLNPNLSEVQDSVCATILLLERLPDLQAVASVTWPLAVTGCMASESHKDFFRSTLRSYEATFSSLKKYDGVLEVLEDAWKKREVDTESPMRWEDLMDHHGLPVLLF